MLENVLYFVPLVVGYVVIDRLLARYFTGRWWGKPWDVPPEET